jgi:hypothetical protein
MEIQASLVSLVCFAALAARQRRRPASIPAKQAAQWVIAGEYGFSLRRPTSRKRTVTSTPARYSSLGGVLGSSNALPGRYVRTRCSFRGPLLDVEHLSRGRQARRPHDPGTMLLQGRPDMVFPEPGIDLGRAHI